MESGTYDAPIYLSEMVQSTDAIYGIDGASAPLFTYQVFRLASVQFCQIMSSFTSQSLAEKRGKSSLLGTKEVFAHQAAILNTVLTQQSPFPGLPNVIQVCISFSLGFQGLCKSLGCRPVLGSVAPCANYQRATSFVRLPFGPGRH